MADSSLYGNQFSSILDAHIQSLQNEYQESQKDVSSLIVFENSSSSTAFPEENPLIKNVARSFSNSFFNFPFFGSNDSKQPSPLPTPNNQTLDSARRATKKPTVPPTAAGVNKKKKEKLNQPQPVFAPPSQPISSDALFLSNCFGIFEHSEEEELDTEEDRMAEKMRFFHPKTVPLDEQLLFIGAIQGFLSFFDGFSAAEQESDPKPLEMIEYKHAKMALFFKHNLVFFVGVPVSTPDYFVKQKLQTILEAFDFFNGPLEHVQRYKCPSYFFYEQLKTICNDLLPLIQQQTQLTSCNFSAIPFLEFPYISSNSLFLMASQCMRSFSSNVYGSCIVLDELVITSQWDSFVTNMMVYRIKQMNSFIATMSEETSHTISDLDDTSISDSTNGNTMNEDATPVSSVNSSFKTADTEWYILEGSNATTNLNQQSLTLHEQSFHSHILFSNQERIDYFPIYLSQEHFKVLLSKLEMEQVNSSSGEEGSIPEYMKPSKEGIYLGAIVFRYGNICMSCLVPLIKLLDVSFIQSMRNQTRDRLKQIEKKIKQHSEYMQLNSMQQAKTFVNSTTSSVVLPPSVLLYDHLQETVNGGNISEKFLEECSMAHELFEADKSFSKFILKQSKEDGYFYAKKVFGSQVYCKPLYSTNNVVPPLQMMQSSNQQSNVSLQSRTRQGSTTQLMNLQQQTQLQENIVTLDRLEVAVRESIKKQYKVNVV